MRRLDFISFMPLSVAHIVCFAFSQKQPLPKALQQKGKQKKR